VAQRSAVSGIRAEAEDAGRRANSGSTLLLSRAFMVRRPQESDAGYPIPPSGISTLGQSPVEVFLLEPTSQPSKAACTDRTARKLALRSFNDKVHESLTTPKPRSLNTSTGRTRRRGPPAGPGAGRVENPYHANVEQDPRGRADARDMFCCRSALGAAHSSRLACS
jgi:hypothetical protein